MADILRGGDGDLARAHVGLDAPVVAAWAEQPLAQAADLVRRIVHYPGRNFAPADVARQMEACVPGQERERNRLGRGPCDRPIVRGERQPDAVPFRERIADVIEFHGDSDRVSGIKREHAVVPRAMAEIEQTVAHQRRGAVRRDIDQARRHQRHRAVRGEVQRRLGRAQDVQPLR